MVQDIFQLDGTEGIDGQTLPGGIYQVHGFPGYFVRELGVQVLWISE